MSDIDRTKRAFVYGIYYSVISCAVVNVIALAIWLAYVLPAVDRKTDQALQTIGNVAAENDRQTKVIRENHDLLIENARILGENQRIHIQNAALVKEIHAELNWIKAAHMKGGAAHD